VDGVTGGELGGFGGKLTIWRDTCAALGAGVVEELATSPLGVGTAGKSMGFGGIDLRAGRGSEEDSDSFKELKTLQSTA
jgi:hypothetical protein